MFDKIRRSASRAVKKAIGDAVEDEVEKEANKQVDKVRNQAQEQIDESAKATKGMKIQKKITGSLITDFDKFKQSWEKNATEPEQSVFHFLIAAYNYCKDPKIGEPMVTLILSKQHNQEDPSSPSGLRLGPTNKGLLNHMREDINIAKSYLGGNYKDDYKFDEKKLVMDLLVVKDEGKYANVIIQSGGKDNPTPVALAKNKNNEWKITEFSSIATGCRKPSSKADDF